MQAPGVLRINQLRQQNLTHLSIGIMSSIKVIKVNEVKNNYWVSKEIEYKNILQTQSFIRSIKTMADQCYYLGFSPFLYEDQSAEKCF